VTIEAAKNRAKRRDDSLGTRIAEYRLSPAWKLLNEIRAYLIRRSEEIQVQNVPEKLLKYYDDKKGSASISMGPSFDKGNDEGQFVFDSGARLSFGLTVAFDNQHSRLHSFRFHYRAGDALGVPFIRFELRGGAHDNPLFEPRCHVHPGLEQVRIPIDIHDPIDILDRIFFVIEPQAHVDGSR
jgi:hypothetical protein